MAGITPQTLISTYGYGGNDANAVLLLHCDGSNGGTTFTDVSTGGAHSPHTMTANGGAVTSTSQAKFGATSLDALAVGRYVSVPTDTDWAFAGDFTWELWAYLPTLPSGTGAVSQVYFLSDATDVRDMMLDNSSPSGTPELRLLLNGVGIYSGALTGLVTNTWLHFAASRAGSSLRMFCNGVQGANGSQTNSTSVNSTNAWRIGCPVGGVFAYIDEVRISKVARYTANFTPPTVPFSF